MLFLSASFTNFSVIHGYVWGWMIGNHATSAGREVVAWMIATRRHVRSVWVTPPEFLERTLRTEMWIEVAADGTVVGEPRVTASSGDPFWDDNAVRAMLNASPLPVPPSSGRWRVAFPTRGDE